MGETLELQLSSKPMSRAIVRGSDGRRMTDPPGASTGLRRHLRASTAVAWKLWCPRRRRGVRHGLGCRGGRSRGKWDVRAAA
jgi:hypothetical protein